jgi:glucuronokinase
MQIIRQRAYARAGLVGNPSDGYHGKTISILVGEFYATAILYEWETIELILSQDDQCRFDSVDELARDVRLHGYYGGIRLVKATIKKFVEFCSQRRAEGEPGYELHDRKFSIRYETNIPRQVGLAGSSAIIVATLRALMEFYGVEIPQRVQPSLVLAVENDELRITAGLQDRVIQVYGGLVYMDFARDAMQQVCGFECGQYEPLDPSLLPPLYIAYAVDVGEPTETLHNPLRALYERGDEKVVRAIKHFASYAAEGRDALLRGDADQLADLINANFDTRASICRLHAEHVNMIETARSVGASAKYAGSGGAIIGTYKNEAMYDELRRKLESLTSIKCRVFKPTVMDTASPLSHHEFA